MTNYTDCLKKYKYWSGQKNQVGWALWSIPAIPAEVSAEDLGIWGQPDLCSKTLSEKTKKSQEEKRRIEFFNIDLT
jgi:hypothetical protein